MMTSEERALSLFDSDSNTASMTAFVNFISENGRSYKDRAETAIRYRNFKENFAAL
jgi:hypothetical protein